MVEFNQGATGREAETSPEHAAAHPRSDEFSRRQAGQPQEEEIKEQIRSSLVK